MSDAGSSDPGRGRAARMRSFRRAVQTVNILLVRELPVSDLQAAGAPGFRVSLALRRLAARRASSGRPMPSDVSRGLSECTNSDHVAGRRHRSSSPSRDGGNTARLPSRRRNFPPAPGPGPAMQCFGLCQATTEPPGVVGVCFNKLKFCPAAAGGPGPPPETHDAAASDSGGPGGQAPGVRIQVTHTSHSGLHLETHTRLQPPPILCHIPWI